MARQRLEPRTHVRIGGVTIGAWHVGGGTGEPVPVAEALAADYEPFEVGQEWGPAWGTTWFRIEGTVPEGRGPVELVVDLGWREGMIGGQAEGLVYDADGRALKAVHPRSGWVRLPPGPFTVYLEAAANPLVHCEGPHAFEPTAVGEKDTAGPAPHYRLNRAELCVFDEETWALLRDLEVAAGIAAGLPDEDPRRWTLLRAVDAALDAADEPAVARAALAPELAKPAHASAHRVTAVGHAHIDSAWLWPVRETVRKVARTVASVLERMDDDPSLVYAMSSAQQYAWLEEHYPELFGRLRDRVAEGRFVPVGGMWVESDTNMPGGEAMVRQFTYGKRYFLERFGVEPREVWLPDSFGYSGALPQLARLAGFRWFLTQKISWNDTNRFPHHTFWWEGIDGTRIFTHFPPADTYNAEVTAAELRHTVRNFREKGYSSHSLVPFGHGDGGGGPTREMLARAARFADCEGAARVTVREPAAFFADAEAELGDAAAVWVGELYLELHRGTFTSQHAMKAGNRRAEALLRTAEYLAASAAVRAGAPYPAAELDEIWRTVLLHQFHDILPGSSIAWVHREARATYAEVERRLTELIDRAAGALRGDREAGPPARLVPADWSGSGAAAWRPLPERETATAPAPAADDGALVLDNGLLRAVIDARGYVVSLREEGTGREIVPPGQALGVLRVHRDEPVRWDAWDVERDARRLFTALDTPVSVTPGPGRVTVTHQGAALPGGSRLTLTISLPPGARQLEFDLHADWREREKLLKVSLPLDLHTASARYETQFGFTERAVHDNTSWHEAHFEDCAHRYVHLSEPGFGVGVVNDTVYGCDIARLGGPAGGVDVRLSLLRSPAFPDPGADTGEHRLRWAVLPSPDIGETVTAGYALGAPLVRGLPQDLPPLLWLQDATGMPVIDTVKLADDGSGDVVARIYEARGGRASAVLRWADELGGDGRAGAGAPGVTVRETDLLERPLRGDDGVRRALRGAEGGGARLELAPFQVVTVRLTRPAAATGRPGRDGASS
ncbi:glycoside hydrolase family 38 C-terminal domain-containing protein [Streptomyces sp. 7-21]|uniref:alpha-mannosidase n=1 Tax=Streptomyces sp. 7-21 TaxID=2802283 RepID=UPI0027DBD957|nr:glycoside hydrolase family 38 C-terminal domain-containing protein [Streptomyces sp. 7-21]